ncbi:maltotransferase domain-containing protein, partial [Micrococcus sp. SIMBA_144]
DDPVGTWKHAATVKLAAGVDVELMLAEGAALFRRAAEDAARSAEDRAVFEEVVRGLEDESLIPAQRLASAESAEVSAV